MRICPYCQWQYKTNKSQQEISKHESTLHQWSCTKCSLRFITQHSLFIHIRKSHTKKLECVYCLYKVTSHETLDLHLSLPHNFECDSCEMKFRRKRDLTSHKVQVKCL